MGDYDDINARNADKARAAGWPELIGTPKQVGWAITVRQNRIDEFDAGPITEPHRSRMRAVLLRETRATIWIDTRSDPWAVVWLANLTDAERDALFPTLGGQP
ncbi:hypothetical protein [Nocardia niigatensis]